MDKSNLTTAGVDLSYHFHPMTKVAGRNESEVRIIERAKGSHVTIEGRDYIDGLSGLGCVNIGYGNEEVCVAAFEVMKTLSYAHGFGGTTNVHSAALAKKLVGLSEGAFEQFFFASTGSDANESAIKMAYYYWLLRGKPEKRLLIARKHGYHGNTIVATSLTGLEIYHPQFGLPLPNLVHHADAPFYSRYGEGMSEEEFGLAAARSIERIIESVGAGKIAALIAEPIQGTAGIIIPPANYWAEVRRICDAHDILLICDEVITGFGKTGEMFGYQKFGFRPDMITLAKGLTSGYFPMSAVGVAPKVMDVLRSDDQDFEHGYTYCAHPVGSAVALANIAVIERRNLVARVADEIEPRIAGHLDRLRAFPAVFDIRAMGVMAAVEFRAPSGVEKDAVALCTRVSEYLFDKGVIGRELGTSLGLILPMVITDAEIDQVFDALYEAVAAIAAETAADAVD